MSLEFIRRGKSVHAVLVIPLRFTWILVNYRDECQNQITGFAGNKHKKFSSMHEAKAFLSQHGVNVGNDVSRYPGPSAASFSVPANSTRRQHGTKPYSRPAVTTKPEDQASGSKPSRWAALTTEVIEDESGWDVVYSDGACKGNGKPGSVAGIGVWWGPDDVRCVSQVIRTNPLCMDPTRGAETSLRDAPERRRITARN